MFINNYTFIAIIGGFLAGYGITGLFHLYRTYKYVSVTDMLLSIVGLIMVAFAIFYPVIMTK